MYHLLLSTINQQTEDKYKIKYPNGKVCGKCDYFQEDDAFNGLIGPCSIKRVYVSKYSIYNLPR